ncbi:MAG: glutamate formimidoyltransferase [Bacteroidaceae bacterium]|nr:glutamate formimidoyltransferase [Bacteroidaceae bacterium]
MVNEKRMMECVPNFSEGRNRDVIDAITREVESTEGVSLLNVDPGEATNRTVVTFVGEPEAVCEAAFRAVRKAGELIDMRQHHGAHPRQGATDVLPLIPISGVTLEECAEMARALARRISDELLIPTYCYEASALRPEHRNLATCRAGEYEALADKLLDEVKGPDYGRRPMDERIQHTGATVVGARDFLVAVNFNLNTTSTRRANAIAFDVREKGRPVRDGNPITGPIRRDADGNPVMRPGTLKATKAIGWYIDEYGIAQVSMNMTDLNVTPLHIAFDEVSRCAQNRGLRVTGTEIVGLVPKRVLIDAGRYFLEKQQRSTGIPEQDIIRIAIRSMGLDELRPFNPREKVIEYLIEDKESATNNEQLTMNKLIRKTLKDFAEETSRESPAPGGGTVAAYMGALGAALGTMVANLSAHKAGWDDRWEHFSKYAEQGQVLLREMLRLVDEDTAAFNALMTAFKMPKKTEAEQAARLRTIESATLHAAEVPLQTMHAALAVFPLCKAMAAEGNPASVSDAGVGALAARSAVLGAALNVRINAKTLADTTKAKALIAEAQVLCQQAEDHEKEIRNLIDETLGHC